MSAWLQQQLRSRTLGVGSQVILTMGLLFVTLMASTLAIDTGWYFAAQNQLQTATDAAALAGGAHMFEGQAAAEEAALDMAKANALNGLQITANNMEFNTGTGSFSVTAHSTVPTIMAKLLCGLAGKTPGRLVDGQPVDDLDGDGEVDATDGCSYMTVSAASKVVGAPRDTVLVIDTSSSMDDLGGGQPFKDVKSAAQSFLDMIVQMEADSPDSVDKVALVKFDKTSSLVRGLTSTQQSPGLNTLKTSTQQMSLYSGSGWNTNYQAGLKVALDEIAAHARPDSHKTIIFFTDGEPNLPEGSTKMNTCVNYYNNRKYTSAKTCAQNYVTYMLSQTDTQITRAKEMDVTIHTLQISDADPGSSLATFRTLLQNKKWEPGLLDTMALETEGQQFEAENTDGDGIMEIFKTVAQIVNLKLATTH
jgi:Flp pilus assembly protein TadG